MDKHKVYANIVPKYITLNIDYDVIEYKKGIILRNAHTKDIVGEYTNLQDVFKAVEGHSKDWNSDMIRLEDRSNGVVFHFESGLKEVHLKDPNKTLEDIEELYNIEILQEGNYYEESERDSKGNRRVVHYDSTGKEDFILAMTDKSIKLKDEKGTRELKRELFYYRDISRNTGVKVIYHNSVDGFSILLEMGVVTALIGKHYIAQTKAIQLVGHSKYKIDALLWLREQMAKLPNNWGEKYD